MILVPDLYQAWHAGVSCWKNFKSLNKYSLGIEINNPGHSHNYKNFNSKQIQSLKRLLQYLMRKYKIKKQNILGHSDVAATRKKDPGEKFPWLELSKSNLCIWHSLNMQKIRKFRKIGLNKTQKEIFFKNIYKLGYRFSKKISVKKNQIYLIKAFQRRFRQSLINGKIDQECLKISKNLILIKNDLT